MNCHLFVTSLVFALYNVTHSTDTSSLLHLSIGWAERQSVVPLQDTNFDCSKVDAPGRYCQHDMSGYFNCQADGVQQIVLCENNSRCSCFSGPRCDDSISDPCQPQQEPPLMALNITSISYGMVHVESIANSTEEYTFVKQQYQAADINGVGQRRGDIQDTTWHENNERRFISIQSTYVPYSTGSYKYAVCLKPGNPTCLQNLSHSQAILPLTDIPSGAIYDGKETIRDTEAERWKLVTGGSRLQDPASVEFFYVGNCTASGYCQPVRYFGIFDYSLHNGNLITVNETFTLVKRKLIENLKPYAMPPQVCTNSTASSPENSP